MQVSLRCPTRRIFGDTVAKYFPVGQYEGEFARFYASVNIESSNLRSGAVFSCQLRQILKARNFTSLTKNSSLAHLTTWVRAEAWNAYSQRCCGTCRDVRAQRPPSFYQRSCSRVMANGTRIPTRICQAEQKFSQVWHMLMKGSIVSAGEGNRDAARDAKCAARLVPEGWQRQNKSMSAS